MKIATLETYILGINAAILCLMFVGAFLTRPKTDSSEANVG
jgi:hypothetical protein